MFLSQNDEMEQTNKGYELSTSRILFFHIN